MLAFVLCSFLALSMFPSVSADFDENSHSAGRIVVGAIIGIGSFVIFLICLSYMLRHRRRTEVIPLRQSFYQPARLAAQNQHTRQSHYRPSPARGHEYGYRSYAPNSPDYSNINLPTYDPIDVPPPAYAKENFSKTKELKD